MKLRLLAIVGALAFALAGCNQSEDTADNQLPTDEPQVEAPSSGGTLDVDENGPSETTLEAFTVTQDEITLSIEFDKAEYDLDSVIGTTVTIKNNSTQTMAYVQGSGSNIKPDALQYNLSGFATLFIPEVATSDYRVDRLEPQQSLTYELDFVPYIALDGNVAFGTDKDLSFFQTEDFTPSDPGVVTGVAMFQYILLAEDASDTEMPDMENPSTLALSIETTITA